MDPASAAVAFVGLGASVVTLTGLVLESYSTLKRVFSAFKHAPREVVRLCRQLAEIESVLRLIGCHAAEFEPEIRIVLASVIGGMQQDLSELRDDVKKLERLLEKERAASRRLEARLRHVLLESKIKEHHRQAAAYVTQLNLILTMSNSSKLDALWKHVGSIDAVRIGTVPNVAKAASTSIPDRIPNGGQLTSYSSPLGTVWTGYERLSSSEAGHQNQQRYTLLYAPPRCLGNISLAWYLDIMSGNSPLPRINVSLSAASYNPSPQFLSAATTFDVERLRLLVREGKASLSDILLDKQPRTLLEVMASRIYQQPVCRVREMYAMALENPSVRDAKFAGAHSRVLNYLASKRDEDLQSSIRLFLDNGGSLLWPVSVTRTVLSLLVRHGAPFDLVGNHLLGETHLWTVDDLLLLDRWFIGVLAHTNPRFRASLHEHLGGYHSPFTVRRRPSSRGVDVFDAALVVREVSAAPMKYRLEFYKALSRWGSKEMLALFVGGMLDPDEARPNSTLPWLRLSYLGKATKCGNMETFGLLLDAGACPTRALMYCSRRQSAQSKEIAGARKRMVLRLAAAASLQHVLGDPEAPLVLLLRSDEVRRYSTGAADSLLERTVMTPTAALGGNLSKPHLDTYLYLAILLNVPRLLDALLQTHGSRIDVAGDAVIPVKSERLVVKPHPLGWQTPIRLSVEFGSVECLRLLTKYLHRPNQLEHILPAHKIAEEYATGKHPRMTFPGSIWPCQPRSTAISQERDTEIRDLLRNLIRASCRTCTRQPEQGSLDYFIKQQPWWRNPISGITPSKSLRGVGRVAQDLLRLSLIESLLLRLVLAVSITICLLLKTKDLLALTW